MITTQPTTHEGWQTLIDEQEKSGLTQKDFCERKNISLVRFGYYIQRYRKKIKKDSTENSPVFSQVFINKPASPSEIVIELPNGFKCTVSSSVQAEQLKKILGALLSC